jgi:hypothetical protein
MPDTPKRPRGPKVKYGFSRLVVFGVDGATYQQLPKNSRGNPDPDWCRAVFTAALPAASETFEAVRKELEVGR